MDNNFFSEIVSKLKEEARVLNEKLAILSTKSEDYNKYIAILKALRETLELIFKYEKAQPITEQPFRNKPNYLGCCGKDQNTINLSPGLYQLLNSHEFILVDNVYSANWIQNQHFTVENNNILFNEKLAEPLEFMYVLV